MFLCFSTSDSNERLVNRLLQKRMTNCWCSRHETFLLSEVTECYANVHKWRCVTQLIVLNSDFFSTVNWLNWCFHSLYSTFIINQLHMQLHWNVYYKTCGRLMHQEKLVQTKRQMKWKIFFFIRWIVYLLRPKATSYLLPENPQFSDFRWLISRCTWLVNK